MHLFRRLRLRTTHLGLLLTSAFHKVLTQFALLIFQHYSPLVSTKQTGFPPPLHHLCLSMVHLHASFGRRQDLWAVITGLISIFSQSIQTECVALKQQPLFYVCDLHIAPMVKLWHVISMISCKACNESSKPDFVVFTCCKVAMCEQHGCYKEDKLLHFTAPSI